MARAAAAGRRRAGIRSPHEPAHQRTGARSEIEPARGVVQRAELLQRQRSRRRLRRSEQSRREELPGIPAPGSEDRQRAEGDRRRRDRPDGNPEQRLRRTERGAPARGEARQPMARRRSGRVAPRRRCDHGRDDLRQPQGRTGRPRGDARDRRQEPPAARAVVPADQRQQAVTDGGREPPEVEELPGRRERRSRPGRRQGCWNPTRARRRRWPTGSPATRRASQARACC